MQLLKYYEDVTGTCWSPMCNHWTQNVCASVSSDMCNPWKNVLYSYVVLSVKTCDFWINVLCNFVCRVVVEVTSVLLWNLCKRSGCDTARETLLNQICECSRDSNLTVHDQSLQESNVCPISPLEI